MRHSKRLALGWRGAVKSDSVADRQAAKMLLELEQVAGGDRCPRCGGPLRDLSKGQVVEKACPACQVRWGWQS